MKYIKMIMGVWKKRSNRGVLIVEFDGRKL
jgi:hypothetical protein